MASLNATLRVPYKTLPDLEIETDVYLPSSTPSTVTKYPVILNIHGGAFMLGSSSMVNKDQVQNCLDRGWIVLALDHRLCPQVSILDGPLRDCRDALAWVYDGGLYQALRAHGFEKFGVDTDRVMGFGTSSGGHLALGLAYGVSRPVAAVLDFYGPASLKDPIWTTPLAHVPTPDVSEEFINRIFDGPVPTVGGMSLEGQGQLSPKDDPRTAFALTKISRGEVIQTIQPDGNLAAIDPCENVSATWPPVCIVHGLADDMVPVHLSRALYARMKDYGVDAEMIEIEGEKHTFAGKMVKGSKVWDEQRKGFDFLEKIVGRGPGF
ncbi:alpha/beta-hydrolase [Pseudovirgaria hyperparasitica]|uniref:Alpha/beta-hydrolase n=1 Tax=Pseudovirgaria hyperparasitica TaxID=470096 RepID=A0A6A6WH36_9PEZI|nr:alpha/beta-hydrolase [Pseudovirgaria hyperparasitica]KAF2762118.1 alpha/beta-hydrolase [Pseudovirgaria hyperparasitica]